MTKQNEITPGVVCLNEYSAPDTPEKLVNELVANSEQRETEKHDCSNKHTIVSDSCDVSGIQRVESMTAELDTDSNTYVPDTISPERENEANNTDKREDSEDAYLPIDRGWAWMILLASFWAYFITIGQMKCFGIFFVQFQRRFGSTSSETSLIFTMTNAVFSVTALLNLTLGSNIPTRVSMFIGIIVACLGSIVTSQIYDVRIAYITIGVANGFANAFIFPHFSTTLSAYFEKRRGFANNIMNSGVSFGAIAMAPLLTKMFEFYGFTGTYFIITGFNFQLLVLVCLVRPISFYKKKKQKVKEIDNSVNEEETMELLRVNAEIIERDSACNDYHIAVDGRSNNKANTDLSITPLRKSNIDGEIRRRLKSDSDKVNDMNSKMDHDSFLNSKTSIFTSTEFMNSSLMDLTLIKGPDVIQHDRIISENENTTDNAKMANTCKSALGKIFAKLFDMKLLSNKVFQYYLLCNAIMYPGCALAISFLPTHAIEMGISDEMAALLVSVPSILDIVSKIAFGYISDKGWCHRSTLIAASSFILGVAAQFMYFMTSFITLMIYAVIAGLLQGVYFSLFVVVIIDILGMEHLKGALGFISLVQGLTGGCALPVAGYLRDFSGSYNYTFNYIGCILMTGGILCYYVPNVHDWHKNKQQKQPQQQSVTQEQEV